MTPTSPTVRRVLQFTDCHLLGDPSATFLGIDPVQTLDAVIDTAFREHPNPDLILLTGDLSQDGSSAAYQLIRQRFNPLGIPVGVIPGNHDRLEHMLPQLSSGNLQIGGTMDCGNWRVLLLDSTVPDQVGGRFERCDLDQLDQMLHHDQRPTLICLHHQPVPIGTTWLDGIGLQNPADFFAVLDRHPAVRGLLWGHVHQAFDDQHRQLALMATPSTSVQFKPHSADFELDRVAPGYRWLELHPDDHIVSGIGRLSTLPAGLDLSSGGY